MSNDPLNPYPGNLKQHVVIKIDPEKVTPERIEELLKEMRNAPMQLVPACAEYTDLIKDMLPYMQHDEDCGLNAAKGSLAFTRGCSCGLSEVLQRINERLPK